MSAEQFAIRTVRASSYRFPLSTSVVTSFGRMLNRPAVFVQIEDTDGVIGWGEVWSNFPAVGAEHRVRIVNEIIAPLVENVSIGHPGEIFQQLTARLDVLALQCGEPGPFAHSIAGLDLALWDLFARRQRQPLWRLLGGTSPRFGVYASGINPTGSAAMAEAALARGHRALKLKIGFDAAQDRDNLKQLRAIVGTDSLAADANQAWDLDEALKRADGFTGFDLAWLEEPIRADRPRQEWIKLAGAVSMPLAAGENVASRDGFAQLIAEGAITVVQPDAAKWGGLSECVTIGRNALAAGRRFCPHYLGGGIGLLASAHLLAAVGGDGLLEIDSNDNPLRDRFCGPVADVVDGAITLSDEPGLGLTPDIESIANLRTA
ncbi:mandelate racemase [Afipia sp. Root123D2]|uniref:mandelate racemase/muconate lactonizing enzyme family protein n=1 Tax=Afipia sp. Root123D2 TaxID=1736436 RepID=UPI0006F7FBAE|nr:mandelate racemase/muconate lactonizing enzyme family protein [Afipia sp. Root123D2]KQW20549.1 mandelate racemase [Afipia sp. Root123D2]